MFSLHERHLSLQVQSNVRSADAHRGHRCLIRRGVATGASMVGGTGYFRLDLIRHVKGFSTFGLTTIVASLGVELAVIVANHELLGAIDPLFPVAGEGRY